MKTLFFPCTLDGLPRHTGSRMIRCEWVAKNWEGAEVFDGTQRLIDFQSFVFQKAYIGGESRRLVQQLAEQRDAGKNVILAFDLCDPDFLDGEHRTRLLDVLPLFDFATAPTLPLVGWLEQWLPAYHVPDGIDLAEVTEYRGFVDNDSPSLVWMGYQGNVGAVTEIAETMAALGLTGDIVSMTFPVSFDKFVEQLVGYDILLNPRPDRAPYMYKSDNKTLVAWAAGVAVARDGAELERLIDPTERSLQIEAGRAYVEGAGNIQSTVEKWVEIATLWGNFT